MPLIAKDCCVAHRKLKYDGAILRTFGGNRQRLIGSGALLSVGIAGPVGFVGLVIPHVVRMICGVDYRWVISYSAVAGGILVTVGDGIHYQHNMMIRRCALPIRRRGMRFALREMRRMRRF